MKIIKYEIKLSRVKNSEKNTTNANNLFEKINNKNFFSVNFSVVYRNDNFFDLNATCVKLYTNEYNFQTIFLDSLLFSKIILKTSFKNSKIHTRMIELLPEQFIVDSETTVFKDQCKICLNNKIQLMFKECKHYCICYSCYQNLISVNSFRCPICRTPSEVTNIINKNNIYTP